VTDELWNLRCWSWGLESPTVWMFFFYPSLEFRRDLEFVEASEAQNTTLAISTERKKNLSLFTRSQINSQLLNLCNEIDVWKLVCQVLVSSGMYKAWDFYFIFKRQYIHRKKIVQRSCEQKHKTRDVKSPTSDRWWPDNVFISGGNPHLTSRFGGVVLGPTTISKMLS